MEKPAVLWEQSRPELTLARMEYIKTNEQLRKAIQEMKDTGISVAAQIISNTIGNL